MVEVDPIVVDGAVYGFLAWVVWYYMSSRPWMSLSGQPKVSPMDWDVRVQRWYLLAHLVIYVLVGASVGWLWP